MMQLFLPILLFAILKSFPQDDMVGSISVSEPSELSSLVIVKKEEVVEDYEERHGLEYQRKKNSFAEPYELSNMVKSDLTLNVAEVMEECEERQGGGSQRKKGKDNFVEKSDHDEDQKQTEISLKSEVFNKDEKMELSEEENIELMRATGIFHKLKSQKLSSVKKKRTLKEMLLEARKKKRLLKKTLLEENRKEAVIDADIASLIGESLPTPETFTKRRRPWMENMESTPTTPSSWPGLDDMKAGGQADIQCHECNLVFPTKESLTEQISSHHYGNFSSESSSISRSRMPSTPSQMGSSQQRSSRFSLFTDHSEPLDKDYLGGKSERSPKARSPDVKEDAAVPRAISSGAISFSQKTHNPFLPIPQQLGFPQHSNKVAPENSHPKRKIIKLMSNSSIFPNTGNVEDAAMEESEIRPEREVLAEYVTCLKKLLGTELQAGFAEALKSYRVEDSFEMLVPMLESLIVPCLNVRPTLLKDFRIFVKSKHRKQFDDFVSFCDS